MRRHLSPTLVLAFLLGTHTLALCETQVVTISGTRPNERISWWDAVDMRQARDVLSESYVNDIRSGPTLWGTSVGDEACPALTGQNHR